MLKAFQDLLDLAKATPRQMKIDSEESRLEHAKLAFRPRQIQPGKPKARFQMKPKKEEADKPKFTVRDLGRKLSSGGNA